MARVSGIIASVVAAAFVLSATSPGMARADMMSACKSDIASYCPDVSRGRGRISACLFSRSATLSADCKPEVATVARKGESSLLVPSSVRRLLGSGSAPAVPAACSADAGKVCSGVDGGSRNVLACLYARTDSVSAGCASAVDTALR